MENELNILISATDEASGELEAVGESMQAMAAEIAQTTSEINANMASMAGETTDATQTMNTDIASVGTLLTGTEQVTSEQFSAMQASMIATGDVATAQSKIMEDDYAAMATASEDAATATEAADEDIEAANTASASSLAIVGGVALLAFMGITGGLSNAVESAQKWNETTAGIAQELKDTGSSIPLSQLTAFASQMQNTTLFSDQATLSAEQQIMSHKDLQGSYQSLTQLSADMATKMGVDLPTATQRLTTALADPVAGMNQLIRQYGIDLPAATVTMIENMAKAGDTADADKELIAALQGQVGGMADAAAKASGAGLTQLSNQLGTLSRDIGQDLIPFLNQMADDMIPIIKNIQDWVTAHPKLTDAILIGTAAFLGLVVVLAAIGIIIPAVIAGILLLASPFALIGLAVVALVAIVALNWELFKTKTEELWSFITTISEAFWKGLEIIFNDATDILAAVIESLIDIFIMDPFKLLFVWLPEGITMMVGLVTDLVTKWGDWMGGFIHTAMTDIKNDWTTIWNDIVSFFSNIWDTIVNDLKTDINNVIGLINGMIEAIDALHINIPAITIPGTKIGTPALDLSFDIPTIPKLAEGGIVTLPTVALIGEAGPEAIVPLSGAGAASYGGTSGQGQPINIYIQGGNYLDKQGADQVAQALATKIQRQLKLTSFR